MTARATVRPPTPESKMPMGASFIAPSLDATGLSWLLLVLECGQHHLQQGLLQPAQRRINHAQGLTHLVLGISDRPGGALLDGFGFGLGGDLQSLGDQDRKSTRLNSSHVSISYAVFCLKKKT